MHMTMWLVFVCAPFKTTTKGALKKETHIFAFASQGKINIRAYRSTSQHGKHRSLRSVQQPRLVSEDAHYHFAAVMARLHAVLQPGDYLVAARSGGVGGSVGGESATIYAAFFEKSPLGLYCCSVCLKVCWSFNIVQGRMHEWHIPTVAGSEASPAEALNLMPRFLPIWSLVGLAKKTVLKVEDTSLQMHDWFAESNAEDGVQTSHGGAYFLTEGVSCSGGESCARNGHQPLTWHVPPPLHRSPTRARPTMSRTCSPTYKSVESPISWLL